MREDTQYINKHMQGKAYPQPDISAAEGWAAMQDMLDAEMPIMTVNPAVSKRKIVLVIIALMLLFWRMCNGVGSDGIGKGHDAKRTEKSDKITQYEKSVTPTNKDFDSNTSVNVKKVAKKINKTSTELHVSENGLKLDDSTANRKRQENNRSKVLKSSISRDIRRINTQLKKESTNENDDSNLIEPVSNKNDAKKQYEIEAVEIDTKTRVNKIIKFLLPNKGIKKQAKKGSFFNKNRETIDRDTSSVAIQNNKLFHIDKSEIKQSLVPNAEAKNTAIYNFNVKEYKHVLPSELVRTPFSFNPINDYELLLKILDTSFPKNILNDSLNKAIAKQGSIKNKAYKRLRLGVQFNVNIPVQTSGKYTTGTNGKNQPLNLLIPNIWMSYAFAKQQSVGLLVTPLLQFTTNNEQLVSTTGRTSITDSSSVKRSVSLGKTSGTNLSLSYQYSFAKHFGLGIGTSILLQNKALISKQTTKVATEVLLSDSIISINKSATEWKYLNSSFFTANVDLSYSFGKFRMGSLLFVPFSSLTASSTNQNVRPKKLQLYFMWNIR